jgi:hypothetical protein
MSTLMCEFLGMRIVATHSLSLRPAHLIHMCAYPGPCRSHQPFQLHVSSVHNHLGCGACPPVANAAELLLSAACCLLLLLLPGAAVFHLELSHHMPHHCMKSVCHAPVIHHYSANIIKRRLVVAKISWHHGCFKPCGVSKHEVHSCT